jgi:hypothetical protein
MEYKEDVKAGNNAGDDINNIAWEYVDYYDIASISFTIKVENNFECEMRAAIMGLSHKLCKSNFHYNRSSKSIAS